MADLSSQTGRLCLPFDMQISYEILPSKPYKAGLPRLASLGSLLETSIRCCSAAFAIPRSPIWQSMYRTWLGCTSASPAFWSLNDETWVFAAQSSLACISGPEHPLGSRPSRPMSPTSGTPLAVRSHVVAPQCETDLILSAHNKQLGDKAEAFEHLQQRSTW